MTAAEFKKTLAELRLSQAEAARRLKVSADAVGMWCRGERKIPRPVEAAVERWALTEPTSQTLWSFVRDHRRFYVRLEQPQVNGPLLWFVHRYDGEEVNVPALGGYDFDKKDIKRQALEAFAVKDNTRGE